MYYREVSNRSLFKFEGNKNNWAFSYIQQGKCLLVREGLEFILDLIKEKENMKEIQIPSPIFNNVECYVGKSGCKDYFYYKPVRIWYEEIPETDFIIERKGKKEKIDLFHESMSGKLNSRFQISSRNFWDMWKLYNEKYINPEADTELLEMGWESYYNNLKFVEVEDKGIEIKIGCKIAKLSPDRKFFIYRDDENCLHKIMIGIPQEISGKLANTIDDYKTTITESFEKIDILTDILFYEKNYIQIIFIDKNSPEFVNTVSKWGRWQFPCELPMMILIGKKIILTTKQINIDMEINHGYFNISQYFNEDFTEENLRIMVGSINAKFNIPLMKIGKKIGDFSEADVKNCICII